MVNDSPLRLEARAEGNGALLWSWVPRGGDSAFVSEVLLTEKHVFVSTDVATYAIERAAHEAVWSVPYSGKLSLSKNGILYIQGTSEIRAFNVK